MTTACATCISLPELFFCPTLYLPFRYHPLCSEYLLWLRYLHTDITAIEMNIQLSLRLEVCRDWGDEPITWMFPKRMRDPEVILQPLQLGGEVKGKNCIKQGLGWPLFPPHPMCSISRRNQRLGQPSVSSSVLRYGFHFGLMYGQGWTTGF